MIRIVLLVGAALTIWICAATTPDSDPSSLNPVFPENQVRARVLSNAWRWSPDLVRLVEPAARRLPRSLCPNRRTLISRGRAIGLRLAVLAQFTPLATALLVAGVAMGLARRQAASRMAAWSSSTLTRLSFYGALVGVMAAVTFIASGVPYWVAFVPLGLLSLSTYLYVGNLPCRV
jgi:hypothetical protein